MNKRKTKQSAELAACEIQARLFHENPIEENFKPIYNLYSKVLFRFLHKWEKDPLLKNEAIASALTKVWARIKLYDPKYRFSNWVFTIATNELKTAYNKTARKKELPFLRGDSDGVSESCDPMEVTNLHSSVNKNELLGFEPDPFSIEYNGIDIDTNQMLEVIEELLPVDSSLIKMALQGISGEAMAKAVGLPENTTRSRLYTARKRLKEKLIEMSQEDL